MEFEEMKKIWNMQTNETLYVINEQALHNRILSKKRSAGHIANISELLLIVVNLATSLLIVGMMLSKPNGNIFMYVLAAWMFMTAVYLLVSRMRRRKNENRFDRSMLGDLHHAISNASYQVRLSRMMLWNNLPIGIFIAFGLWQSGKFSAWLIVVTLALLALANYAGGWEHRFYKRRKRELETLLHKLENEEAVK